MVGFGDMQSSIMGVRKITRANRKITTKTGKGKERMVEEFEKTSGQG